MFFPSFGKKKFSDWDKLLGESVLLRQQLHKRDPDINPYTLPHIGATEKQLDEVEHKQHMKLDPLYRHLLSYANGWEHFFTFTHLFEVQELGVSKRFKKASELVDIFYSDGPVPKGMPQRSHVLCFCANPDEVEDLFVIWLTGPVKDGGRPISWLAGEEIQRFANMHEFMLSVNEYLRRKLAKLQK